MKWLKKLIAKYYTWKLKYKYRKMELAPQGQCLIQYIIDYYINETIKDPTDRYEEAITTLSKKIQLPKTAQPIPEELIPSFLHYHAAIVLLKGLLVIAPNKEEWLSRIKDEEIKQMIAHPIIV